MQNKNGFFNPIVIITLLILVAGVLFFTYTTLARHEKYASNTKNFQGNIPTVSQTTNTESPAESAPTSAREADGSAYLIKVNNVKDLVNYPGIAIKIALMGEDSYARRYEDIKIFYNALEYETIYAGPANNLSEKEFYVYLKGMDASLQAGNIYETSEISVSIDSEMSELVPYLANNDYCEYDSDCTIRYDWCVKGGWNNYTEYRNATGCTYGNNEGQSFDIVQGLKCEAIIGDGVIAQYESVSCINNSCMGSNPVFSCAKSTEEWVDDNKNFRP